jgi:serine/threonine protein kinase
MPFFCIHCKSEIDPKFKACPFCGDAITDFLRRYLETPIDGKYRILSRLGVGGMGEVYKVLHIHLNAIRVIKLMRANIASDAGANERFLREARLATKIQHPSVAALFDFSTLEDGSHYMVWEYIEGINLHELIDQRGPLSPRYAATLAAQALMGLDAIHRAGIVHRDISPENIMITREVGADVDERVKIIDLGIAKSLAADDNNTKTGMFVGKWKYCSPEHLGMLPPGETIDGRADLYSFGIVLYEMLTGVPPFQADTPHAYLMLHSQQRPKALRDANPLVAAPPELEALIFRALEKDRANRFTTAREFAQALERIAPDLSDVGGAPPPLPATADLTDEATRVAPKYSADALTVLTAQEAEPTRISDRELFAVPVAPEPADAQPGGRARWLAPAAAALALVAGAGWFLTRNDQPAAPPEVTSPAAMVQAAALPIQTPPPAAASAIAAPRRLAINAFPWAAVASIRNLDNGESIDLGAQLLTPATVDVAPGRYELTLTNPSHAKAITRTVTVADGEDTAVTVHFTDPGRAPLPDFGGER